MAQDWLAGRSVACPACGVALQIPSPQVAPRNPMPAGGHPQAQGTGAYAPTGAPAGRGPVSQPGYARPTQAGSGGETGLNIGLKVAMGMAVAVVGLVLVVIVLSSILSRDSKEIAGRKPATGSTSQPSADSGYAPQTNPFRSDGAPQAQNNTPYQHDGSSTWTPRKSDYSGGQSDSSVFVGAPIASNDASSGVSAKPTTTSPTVSSGPLPAAVDRWYSSSGSLRGAQPVEGEDFVITQYSWMCNLLPYLGQDKLYNEFDFQVAWTDERNARLCTTVVPAFLNPADDRDRWTGLRFRGLALTHFVGMSGVEDGRRVVAAALPRSDPRAGVFGYDEVADREDITDGASQTITIIGSGEIVAPWVQGGGATIRGAREPYFDPLTGFGSRGLAKPGVAVLMADGSTRHLGEDVDPSVFRAMCTIHGADSVDVSHFGPAVSSFPGTK